MLMPGRSYNSAEYRYGFNGKEKDDEVKNTSGTQYDYGFRIYDPRLGKFLSVDPLTSEFPWNSTYAFAENDVIRNLDLDGLEKHPYQYLPKWMQTTIIKIGRSNAAADGWLRAYKTVTGKEPGPLVKTSAYLRGYLLETGAGNYADQNDVAVLTSGRNFDGTKATTGDYVFAGIFVMLPVSGGVFKEGAERMFRSVDDVFAISAKELKVSDYAFKHVASSKVSWSETVKGTLDGPAKFMNGTDVEGITRQAWDNGSKVNNGKTWKIFDAGKTVGAKSGQETQYMRVELTSSTGELHSSPITQSEYKKLTKQ